MSFWSVFSYLHFVLAYPLVAFLKWVRVTWLKRLPNGRAFAVAWSYSLWTRLVGNKQICCFFTGLFFTVVFIAYFCISIWLCFIIWAQRILERLCYVISPRKNVSLPYSLSLLLLFVDFLHRLDCNSWTISQYYSAVGLNKRRDICCFQYQPSSCRSNIARTAWL